MGRILLLADAGQENAEKNKCADKGHSACGLKGITRLKYFGGVNSIMKNIFKNKGFVLGAIAFCGVICAPQTALALQSIPIPAHQDNISIAKIPDYQDNISIAKMPDYQEYGSFSVSPFDDEMNTLFKDDTNEDGIIFFAQDDTDDEGS